IKVEELKWDIPGGKVSLSMTSGKKQTVTLQLPPGVRIQTARMNGQDATNTEPAGRPNGTRLPLPEGGIVRVELAFAPGDFSAVWEAVSAMTGRSK
ncbi:MAG: hypothetical protein NTW21_31605, partial [Verrucomicrobia bacterium]|nr:hypothetical protein [Verrucomicrobiota bacterium]